MLDLTRTRADVDQALSQAISSRDVTEQATSIQQQSSRLKAASYLQAGEAIGRGIETGLTKAFDPTERLAKQNMIRQSQAQAEDNAKRDYADKVRASGVEVQGQGVYDRLGVKDTPDQSFRNLAVTKYGKSIADALPQDVKDQGASFFKELRGPAGATRFHAYPKGAELQAGKYGSKEYMGRSWAEAPDVKKELEEGAWDKIESLPSMRAFLLDRGVQVQVKNSLGKQGLAGSLSVYNATNDKDLTAKATQIEDMWNDDTKRDYKVGDSYINMSLREAGARNMIDQRFVRDNIQAIISRAPRSAVTKDGKYHQTFDPETLKQVVESKDKLDAAMARNLLDMESSKANSLLARWDVSKTAFNRVMSMDWLKNLSPDQQAEAQKHINNIANMTKGGAARLGQVSIATKNGVALGGDELADAVGAADAVTTVGKINAELDALKAISPQVKDLIMPGAGKSKSQFDLLQDQAVENSMVSGNFAGQAGPLAKLMAKDVTDAEAAHIWNLMRDGAVNSPQFDNLTAKYTAVGMNEADARSMAITHGAEFERRLSVALSTPDPTGNNKEWTEAEKEEIADEIAKIVTAPSLKAFQVNKGATGRVATNMVAGRDADTLSFSDASDYVSRAMKAMPELKDKGLVELDLGNDRTIIALNGKAAGYRKGDKASTFALLKGEFPTHLTESLHAASKMARDLVGMDLETNFRWDSLSPLKATGDKGVDEMMRATVGSDGQSTYLWLKNHFKSDMRLAKDNDTAQALYENLMNAAKKAGQDPWQMKDRLTAAAANTEDPVLEATAIFLGEALSPHKVTLKDLKDVEGGYPSGLVASIGNKKAAAEINDTGQAKDIAEAYDQNTGTAVKNTAQTKADTDFTGLDYGVALGTSAVGGFITAGIPGAAGLTALTGGTMAARDINRGMDRFEKGEWTDENPDAGAKMEKNAKYANSPEGRAASEKARKENDAYYARKGTAKEERMAQAKGLVDAMSPSRSRAFGQRAESRPASRPESRAESRAESAPASRAETRPRRLGQERQGSLHEEYERDMNVAAQRHKEMGIQGADNLTFEEWKVWKASMENLKVGGTK